MAKQGQTFKHYSEEIKLRAIQMKLAGVSHRDIVKELGIYDEGRIRRWMQKFKKLGEFGLLDQRGRPEAYVDEGRYVEQLKRENRMLKKCLEIWMREVQRASTELYRKQQVCTASRSSAPCLASQEADITHF